MRRNISSQLEQTSEYCTVREDRIKVDKSRTDWSSVQLNRFSTMTTNSDQLECSSSGNISTLPLERDTDSGDFSKLPTERDTDSCNFSKLALGEDTSLGMKPVVKAKRNSLIRSAFSIQSSLGTASPMFECGAPF
uniref:Uncharacterized protein n=1 Tax=Cacopsylla melanoneura TaxID=428564 RepID=A0A8D8QJ78_9HEMI